MQVVVTAVVVNDTALPDDTELISASAKRN